MEEKISRIKGQRRLRAPLFFSPRLKQRKGFGKGRMGGKNGTAFREDG